MSLQSRAAGIYTRISADDGTALGVARQEKQCRAHAAALGWDVVAVFTDNDVSATRSKVRPQYQRMLQAIETGAIDAIVVWDVDRLTRAPREMEDLIELAGRTGVEIAVVDGRDDFGTDDGQLMLRIKAGLARREVAHNARRLRAKFAENAEKGLPHGYPPYGYRRVMRPFEGRQAGLDEPDPVEAPIVREIVERTLSGESLRSIAKDLNARGIESPGDAAARKRAERLGAPHEPRRRSWSTTVIRQVAMRPSNAGLRQYRGQIIGSSLATPIVTRDDFDRVSALLKDPTRGPNKRSAPVVYLLSGLLVCGKCGEGRLKGAAARSHTSPTGRVKNTRATYFCDSCYRIRRVQAPIDEAVVKIVLARLQQEDAVRVFATTDHRAARAARDELATIDARLAGAADHYASGEIDGAQLTRITAMLRPQRERAARRLVATESDSPVAALVTADNIRERWDEMDIQQRRAVIDHLLTITVLPIGSGHEFTGDDLEIVWKAH